MHFMGSDPRLAGLSEPLRLQANQHPGGLLEDTEHRGGGCREPDGDTGGSCQWLEAPAGRFPRWSWGGGGRWPSGASSL